MAADVPIFAFYVRGIIDLVILFLALVVLGVSFVHCLTQRADAFPAIGTLPKGGWLAILGLCMVFCLLLSRQTIFQMIGIAAAMVYLLDVRAGLRDLSDGKGFW
ncbi:type III secretory pathway component EscU [Catenuloplanes nepalensis]|uniref:Type III secretory pathway component EscU n=1 Tax=Catenuloplanes nepalensis TaxID=587533 RepID=A0ABT9N3K8_9ACTN|nr:DUF2516 family protein [Catenuloplanes nepalensis]MDP9798093.1 type III secretory pathway component EscU [Catenuloplanes nepalensis]